MRSLLLAATLMICLAGPRQAEAFVRSTTCPSICQQVCARDGICADGGWGSTASDCEIGQDCGDCGIRMDASVPASERCAPEQQPLGVAWCERSLEFATDDELRVAAGSADQTRQVVERSLATWTSVPSSDVRLERTDAEPEAASAIDLINRIVVVDASTCRVESGVRICGWQSEGYGAGAVGVTLVSFDTDTGRIFDADVFLNADTYDLVLNSDGAADESVYDVENTLTHELGHALGLDHCHDSSALGLGSCETATMRVSTRFNETNMRSLSQDDIAGVSFIYPRGRRNPDELGCESPKQRGCSASRVSHPYSWIFVLVALMRRRR